MIICFLWGGPLNNITRYLHSASTHLAMLRIRDSWVRIREAQKHTDLYTATKVFDT
jgi:hypothetical protein